MARVAFLLGALLAIAACSRAPTTQVDAPLTGADSTACLQKLVGRWEGTISVRGVAGWDGGVNRTLDIVYMGDGRIYGFYGITGRTLLPVNISVEFGSDSCRPILRFLTPANSRITLTLIRDGWLEGQFGIQDWEPKNMQLVKTKDR